MSIEALLDRAKAAGVILFAEGEQIRYRGPAGAVRTLVPELKAHKPALIAALSERASQAEHTSAAADETAAHWLILPVHGKPVEKYFTPDVSRAELARRFPDAALVALPDTTAPPPAWAYERGE